VRQCEDAGCRIDVSWALEEHPDKTERRAAEDRLIGLHDEVMGFEGELAGHDLRAADLAVQHRINAPQDRLGQHAGPYADGPVLCAWSNPVPAG
jgi:hypothetical protein